MMTVPTRCECFKAAASSLGAVLLILAIFAVLAAVAVKDMEKQEASQEVREQRLAILEGRQ